MSGGEARGFEYAERAVLELGHEYRRVVDCDVAERRVLAGFAGKPGHPLYYRTLRDEGLRHTHDPVELADQIARRVDNVRAEVAERARAADFLVEPPDERVIGIDYIVLQKRAAEMEYLAYLAGVYQLFCQYDRRSETVVEADLMLDFRLFGGGEHLARVRRVQRERLLRENVLSCFGSGERDFLVYVRRRGDVDNVDVVARDELLPRGLAVLPAELLAALLDPFGVATADCLLDDIGGGVKEHRELCQSVRMSLAHEFVSDQTYIDFLFHNRDRSFRKFLGFIFNYKLGICQITRMNMTEKPI